MFLPITSKSIFSRLPLISKIVSKIPIIKFGIRPSLPLFNKNIIFRKFQNFDSRFDELWKKSSKEIIVGGIRDSSYLQWRFVDRPFSPYTKILAEDNRGNLLGYIVTIVREKHNGLTGYIMDMLTLPQKRILKDRLLFLALKTMKDEGADQVLAIVPYRHSTFLNYLSYGFIPLWEKLFPFKLYFGVVVHGGS